MEDLRVVDFLESGQRMVNPFCHEIVDVCFAESGVSDGGTEQFEVKKMTLTLFGECILLK